MQILLDSNVLGMLCHPRPNLHVARWLQRILIESKEAVVIVPEIADYELRRKLLHLAEHKGSEGAEVAIKRLDQFTSKMTYAPLTTGIMRRAAGLWAQARGTGQSTAPDHALDGDVILAAQALEVEGTVITENVRHLKRFVDARRWQDI